MCSYEKEQKRVQLLMDEILDMSDEDPFHNESDADPDYVNTDSAYDNESSDSDGPSQRKIRKVIGDLLYRHSVTFDNVITEVEILDTSKCGKDGCLYEHIRWGEAFVVVYSVNDKHSFREAQELLGQLAKLKLPSYYTSLLLGNKRDLDHCRQICVDDGQELSLQFGCQFYEVSAAENFAGVSLAFQSLLREAKSVQLLKALPIRRKLGVNSVSKVLGNIFGKNSKGDRKKRPSLSI